MTSCLTSRSIASMRVDVEGRALCPCPRLLSRPPCGTMPSSAMASAACASISNQMRKRVSGDQMAAIRAGCSGGSCRRVTSSRQCARCRFGSFADRRDVACIGPRTALEDGRAGDQHIGAGAGDGGAVSAVMPPSTSMSIGAARRSAPACANLIERRRDEGLAAEAGIDRHHQHEIDEIEDVLDVSTGVAGLSDDAGLFAERARSPAASGADAGPPRRAR